MTYYIMVIKQKIHIQFCISSYIGNCIVYYFLKGSIHSFNMNENIPGGLKRNVDCIANGYLQVITQVIICVYSLV